MVQTAFLGDVVLTTPLIAAIAARDGEPVDVVTTPAAAPLLETHPAVRHVIPYDKRHQDRGLTGLARVARRLAAGAYQAAYVPHRSLRSAAVTWRAGVPRRVGFVGRWSFLYTEARPRPTRGREGDRLLVLADAAPGAFQPRLYPTDADDAIVGGLLEDARIADGFVALAPGSVWGTKRWPYYGELAARLAPHADVVVVGATEDTALGDGVVAGVARTGGRAANLAGKLSVRESVAVIARAGVLVTNDSAPLHFASAVGTPVVALFGPTIPAFGFEPLGPADVTLGVSLPCRPCSNHGPPVCPLGHHRCMRDLDLEHVFTAIEDIRALRRRH